MTPVNCKGYAMCKDTKRATTKLSYPSPASYPPPGIWLIVSRHYYCCLAMFPSLVSLYGHTHRDLSVSRAQWVLWGYILSTGFWCSSIIFHSFGKNKSLIFPYRFQFLTTYQCEIIIILCLNTYFPALIRIEVVHPSLVIRLRVSPCHLSYLILVTKKP